MKDLGCRFMSWGQAPALWDYPHPLDSGPVSGYGACFCRSDESGGRIDQMAGRLGHRWGRAPRLRGFPSHPLDSGFRRNDECEGIPTDAGMTRPTVVTGTIHPGSESGTCFRTNRSCRQGPAHEGMKIGAPVGGSSLRLLGTRVGCRSAWSGGQAPALHSSFPARNEHELEDVSSPAIPDRSPGHAFVPMTKSGTRRTRRVPGVQGG